ncbi:hypothetical protein MRX96_042481 [Rhipicephalus microplus]
MVREGNARTRTKRDKRKAAKTETRALQPRGGVSPPPPARRRPSFTEAKEERPAQERRRETLREEECEAYTKKQTSRSRNKSAAETTHFAHRVRTNIVYAAGWMAKEHLRASQQQDTNVPQQDSAATTRPRAHVYECDRSAEMGTCCIRIVDIPSATLSHDLRRSTPARVLRPVAHRTYAPRIAEAMRETTVSRIDQRTKSKKVSDEGENVCTKGGEQNEGEKKRDPARSHSGRTHRHGDRCAATPALFHWTPAAAPLRGHADDDDNATPRRCAFCRPAPLLPSVIGETRVLLLLAPDPWQHCAAPRPPCAQLAAPRRRSSR